MKHRSHPFERMRLLTNVVPVVGGTVSCVLLIWHADHTTSSTLIPWESFGPLILAEFLGICTLVAVTLGFRRLSAKVLDANAALIVLRRQLRSVGPSGNFSTGDEARDVPPPSGVSTTMFPAEDLRQPDKSGLAEKPQRRKPSDGIPIGDSGLTSRETRASDYLAVEGSEYDEGTDPGPGRVVIGPVRGPLEVGSVFLDAPESDRFIERARERSPIDTVGTSFDTFPTQETDVTTTFDATSEFMPQDVNDVVFVRHDSLIPTGTPAWQAAGSDTLLQLQGSTPLGPRTFV